MFLPDLGPGGMQTVGRRLARGLAPHFRLTLLSYEPLPAGFTPPPGVETASLGLVLWRLGSRRRALLRLLHLPLAVLRLYRFLRRTSPFACLAFGTVANLILCLSPAPVRRFLSFHTYPEGRFRALGPAGRVLALASSRLYRRAHGVFCVSR
jgi:hypothetical protein